MCLWRLAGPASISLARGRLTELRSARGRCCWAQSHSRVALAVGTAGVTQAGVTAVALADAHSRVALAAGVAQAPVASVCCGAAPHLMCDDAGRHACLANANS